MIHFVALCVCVLSKCLRVCKVCDQVSNLLLAAVAAATTIVCNVAGDDDDDEHSGGRKWPTGLCVVVLAVCAGGNERVTHNWRVGCRVAGHSLQLALEYCRGCSFCYLCARARALSLLCLVAANAVVVVVVVVEAAAQPSRAQSSGI